MNTRKGNYYYYFYHSKHFSLKLLYNFALSQFNFIYLFYFDSFQCYLLLPWAVVFRNFLLPKTSTEHNHTHTNYEQATSGRKKGNLCSLTHPESHPTPVTASVTHPVCTLQRLLNWLRRISLLHFGKWALSSTSATIPGKPIESQMKDTIDSREIYKSR